jgi:hypothetical protein
MPQDMMDTEHIARKSSAEMAAIILLLRKRLGTADADAVRTFKSGFSPAQAHLLRLMDAHEVGGIVYDRSVLDGWLDPAADAELQASMALRARSNLMLFRETVSFAALMRDLGFPVVFHKGVLLGMSLFGDLTTRPTRDIDVMVRREDFLALRGKLLGMGFEEVYHFPLAHARYYMGINREATFRKRTAEGLLLHIEVQWAPVLPLYDIPYDNEYFFRHAQTESIGGAQLVTLDPVAQLLILLLHHGVTDLWRSLRHVSDLAFFLQRFGDRIDWAEVDRIATQWRFKRNAGVGFGLCRDLLGVPLPTGWELHPDERALARTMHSLLSYPMLRKRQDDPAFLRRQFLLAEDAFARGKLGLSQLRKILSPSLFELEHLSLPPALFPLYYLAKPFRFLFRYRRS